MITFANPAFLWGFVALAVPLAIHLLSRKEGRIIYIGSLRHLQESNTRQSISIQLNELLLLALRMLMIALLVLLMSGVNWKSNSISEKKWLLLERGLHNDTRMKIYIDSLVDQKFELHFLSDGFPSISDSINISSEWNAWDLLRSLEKENLTRAVIFSYSYLKNFAGERIELPINITWIPIESLPADFNLKAVRENASTIYLTRGHSASNGTSFESQSGLSKDDERSLEEDSIKIDDPESLIIYIIRDSSFKDDAAILKAAIKAIQSTSHSRIEIKESSVASLKDAPSDWIIWLSEKPYAGIRLNNRIVYKDNPAAPLISKYSSHEWLLSHRLGEEIALKENLPITISGILFPAWKNWARAMQYDRRAIDESMAWSVGSPNKSNMMSVLAGQDESIWILGILVTIFLLERMIAHHKNQ